MSKPDENDDLLIASTEAFAPAPSRGGIQGLVDSLAEDEATEITKKPPSGIVQWSTADDKSFFGASTTRMVLPPGLYDIQLSSSQGLFFERVPIKTEGLLRFPDSAADRVIREISLFWDRASIFKQYGLIHKRGILLMGPPGGGKSSLIQILLKDVCQRGGVAVRFGHPSTFLLGMRLLREIQPDTPVVVLMEDLDSIIENFNESLVLNILDGVELVNRSVFLASTNYPERLGPRIVNRPSRFDKRILIGYPSPEARRLYFEHLVSAAADNVDLERWVLDTEGFSFAHMRELFIATLILGDPYEEALATLRGMNQLVTSADDYQSKKRKKGFLGSHE